MTTGGTNSSCTFQVMNTTIDAERRELIDRLFENHDFEPDVVLEANGWQHNEPDVYHSVIFFDAEPSRYAIFSVTFKPNSAEVLDYGI